MRYLITSDVHIGSRFFQRERFLSLLQHLNDDIILVLGGDTIDDPRIELDEAEQAALTMLIERSERSGVIWINGNHDDGYRPPNRGKIRFKKELQLGERLYVAHGDQFDNIMPYNRWFIRSFRFLHGLRIRLGARPVHVAHYAKKFKPLYNFLRRNIRENAVEHAREIKVRTVACGHVHFAEDTRVGDIRYVNLGAWTEAPTYCLLVDDNALRLMPTPDAMEDKTWFSAKGESSP